MLNRVIFIGRLTKDPELRQTQSGKEIATFTLAVNRKFKQDETDFIPVIVWGKAADSCGKYLAKGKMAAVDGRLKLENYIDKDGIKRLSVEVEADDVRFLSPKGSQDASVSNAPEPLYEDDDLPF